MDTRVIYTQLLSSIQFPPFLAMEYIATQPAVESPEQAAYDAVHTLSLIHISEPTRH